MDPLQWLQQNYAKFRQGVPAGQQTVNVKGQPPRPSAIVRSPGGALGATDGVTRIGTNLKVPGGGPGLGTSATIANLIDPYTSKPLGEWMGDHAADGAMMLMGISPERRLEARAGAAGRPVVRNLGGVSYNINTPEGRKGYEAAKKRGETDTTPEYIEVQGADGRTRKVNPKSEAGQQTIQSLTPKVAPERGDGSDDAPDGSGAKGTNTGFKGFSIEDINANLSAIGAGSLADATPFLSEALPVTKPGSDQQQLANPSQPVNNSPTISPNGDPYAGPGFGVPANDAVVEGPSTPNPGAVVDTQSADNARSVSVPGEPRNWMEPRQKSWAETRREAFLSDAMDDKGSLAATRAAHAATGAYDQMTPYGHKYAIRTGDDLQYVDRDTYKTYNRTGKLSAADFKEGYASGVKSTLVPVSQPDITNPDAPVNPTPAGEFNMNNLAPNPPVPAGMNDEPVDVELTQTMKDLYFKNK